MIRSAEGHATCVCERARLRMIVGRENVEARELLASPGAGKIHGCYEAAGRDPVRIEEFEHGSTLGHRGDDHVRR